MARALAGTEGTCATVLEATLDLVPNPPERVLLVIAYDDICSAGDHCAEIMAHRPMGLEAIDHRLFLNEQRLHLHTRELGLLPEGAPGCWQSSGPRRGPRPRRGHERSAPPSSTTRSSPTR